MVDKDSRIIQKYSFFPIVFKTWAMPGTPGTPASFSEIPRFKNLTEVTLNAEMSMLDLIGTL